MSITFCKCQEHDEMEMAASMGASQCSSETVFVNDDFDHYL